MNKNIEETINSAHQLIKNGLKHIQFESFDKIKPPTISGVYIIRNNNGEVIYIGKAKNLRRRILNDHFSAEKNDTTSAFRRSIYELYGIHFGKEMHDWVSNNCRVGFIGIEDHDTYSLVEAILIASFRTKELLNKPMCDSN